MDSIRTGTVYIRKLLWLVRLPFGAWLTISKKSWCRNGQIYKTRPYIKLVKRYDGENW